jgi:hypothetical protein
MIVTSVSLPEKYAKIWRRKRKRIMRYAMHTYRTEMIKRGIQRGVTRRYNRIGKPMVIVTVRFKPDEFDVLQFVSGSVRISVSLLLFLIIKNWLQRRAGKLKADVQLHYSVQVDRWNSTGFSVTETLQL